MAAIDCAGRAVREINTEIRCAIEHGDTNILVMNPAAAERTAPMRKPTATSQPSIRPTTRKMTIPTMAIVVYWRLR